MPPELQLPIEGLALHRPPPTIATVHRQAAGLARAQGWPVPGYAAVYDVVQSIDPAMATLAHEGSKRYREVSGLVYRREAATPNEIWQADHTLLDLWVLERVVNRHHPAAADAAPGTVPPVPGGRQDRDDGLAVGHAGCRESVAGRFGLTRAQAAKVRSGCWPKPTGTRRPPAPSAGCAFACRCHQPGQVR